MIKYKSEPYTINEIKSLLDYSNNIPIASKGLLRSKEQQIKYEEFKKQTVDINKYIITEFLNNKLDKDGILFTKNSFSYFVPNNSKHYLLWSKNTLDSQTIIETVKNILSTEKFIFFENKYSNKTIKKIIHYHIITY